MRVRKSLIDVIDCSSYETSRDRESRYPSSEQSGRRELHRERDLDTPERHFAKEATGGRLDARNDLLTLGSGSYPICYIY